MGDETRGVTPDGGSDPDGGGASGQAEQERPRSVALVAGELDLRGSVRYGLYLVRGLVERGVRCMVLTPGGPLVEAYVDAGARVREGVRTAGLLGRDLLAVTKHERMCRAAKVELVHALWEGSAAHAGRLAERLEVPWTCTVHAMEQPLAGLRKDTVRLRTVIAVSQAVREDLVNRARVPKELTTVIHNGVDPEVFGTDVPSRQAREPDTAPTIGIVGPLEAVRGHRLFLQMARRLTEEGVDAHYLVIGSGPEERELRRLTDDWGLAHRLTIHKDLRTYERVLEAVDIFVQPSLNEGLGLTLLEEMACGKPVVASGVGGTFSVIQDGETGFLVPKGDVEAMVDTVRGLAADPGLCRDVGLRARRMVAEEFHVDAMLDATQDAWRTAVGAGETGD